MVPVFIYALIFLFSMVYVFHFMMTLVLHNSNEIPINGTNPLNPFLRRPFLTWTYTSPFSLVCQKEFLACTFRNEPPPILLLHGPGLVRPVSPGMIPGFWCLITLRTEHL